jgi:hypothetical protein
LNSAYQDNEVGTPYGVSIGSTAIYTTINSGGYQLANGDPEFQTPRRANLVADPP